MKLIGWKATLLHDDPCAYDRWKWLQKNITSGKIKTLDAGCGTGAFSFYASKIGNHITGLSFDKTNNQTAVEDAKFLKLKNIYNI